MIEASDPTFWDLFNPENIIRYGGIALLVAILFAESGIFFCFFLPGDSLLFTAGLLIGTEYLPGSVQMLIPVLVLASMAGSILGYYSGKWARFYFGRGEDGLLFKKKHMDMTEEFYLRHGMFAFIFGKYLPVIRTFITILAGVTSIRLHQFVMYNLLGTTIWISSLVLAGHLLGRAFPNLINYLEFIVIGMIIITAIPVITVWLKKRASKV